MEGSYEPVVAKSCSETILARRASRDITADRRPSRLDVHQDIVGAEFMRDVYKDMGGDPDELDFTDP
ncbi:hypothetical protein ACW9YQ_07540 [Paraburkholderia strydomiana]